MVHSKLIRDPRLTDRRPRLGTFEQDISGKIQLLLEVKGYVNYLMEQ